MKNALYNFAEKYLPTYMFNLLKLISKYFKQVYEKIMIPEFINTKYGFKIKAVSGDINMRTTFYKTGKWEPHVTDIIQKTVKKGDICLDIGANVGFDTMILSQVAGENGTVYAFEPSPRIFSILKENIEYNKMSDNVKLMHHGLGSKAESVTLYMDSFNPGGSTICHNYGGFSEEIHISVFDELNIDRVDFIKMDIEGYEYEALLGMKKALEKNKDIKIVFEWSPQYYNNLSKDGKGYSINILSFLVGQGFSLYELDPINIGEKIKVTDFEALYIKIGDKFGSHTDILAVRE